MTKLVKDLMHAGLITCKPDATIGQVAVLLNQHHIHALGVTDRDRRVIGIISDFDLLAGEWLSSDSESLNTMRSLTASDLMSHPVDSVEANIPLSDAVRVLIEKDISRLLVTDKGKPVGIISLSDFVASIAGEEKAKRETVGDVMSDAILVCRGKTPIASAARAMTSAGWRSVLVVDAKGKVLGVVSGKDLLRFVKNGVSGRPGPAVAVTRPLALAEQTEPLIKRLREGRIVASTCSLRMFVTSDELKASSYEN